VVRAAASARADLLRDHAEDDVISIRTQGRRLGAVLATATAAVAAGGCGEEEVREQAAPAAREAAAASFPVTVRAGNGGVRVERPPRRIVSLSPTATETLFALGAGEQVVAVDDQSDFPRGAPQTDLSGYRPSVEAIATYRPDLVVVSDTGPRDVVAGLERLGVAVLLEPAAEDLEEAYDQIGDLGAATGHRDRATRLVARMRERIAALVRRAGSGDGEPLRVLHELGTDGYAASSQTFIGRVYALFGLRNVADRAARRAGSPYPQVSAEEVVAADPDLVVQADGEVPGGLERRPGWRGLEELEDDTVVAVDEDIASRWGPRVVDFTALVAEAVRTARGAG
jgi:iron complex transport system substrate-binding protein